jgi:hypothetical protein
MAHEIDIEAIAEAIDLEKLAELKAKYESED